MHTNGRKRGAIRRYRLVSVRVSDCQVVEEDVCVCVCVALVCFSSRHGCVHGGCCSRARCALCSVNGNAAEVGQIGRVGVSDSARVVGRSLG